MDGGARDESTIRRGSAGRQSIVPDALGRVYGAPVRPKFRLSDMLLFLLFRNGRTRRPSTIVLA